MVDPFYRTPRWRALCEAVRRRSGGRCEVRGCTAPGKVVDHIKARERGGPDTLDNLRHLCRLHDNQVKEDASGNRRRGGEPYAVGCDASGRPLDPLHPFFTGAITPFKDGALMGAGPAGHRKPTKFVSGK